jgi:hypothetical protein
VSAKGSAMAPPSSSVAAMGAHSLDLAWREAKEVREEKKAKRGRSRRAGCGLAPGGAAPRRCRLTAGHGTLPAAAGVCCERRKENGLGFARGRAPASFVPARRPGDRRIKPGDDGRL